MISSASASRVVVTLSGERKLCAAMPDYERQIVGFSTEFAEPEKQLIVFDQCGSTEEDVVRICERLRCACICVGSPVYQRV